MEVSQILIELDKEIARLQEARTLLAGGVASSQSAAKKTAAGKGDRRRGPRNLSPEGKRRIGEAMKKRWAERKKQAAAKAAK